MDYMDRQNISAAKYEERMAQIEEDDRKQSLEERKVKALESIAESLKKIAGCVQNGCDGFPTLSTTDVYQEWRNNLA